MRHLRLALVVFASACGLVRAQEEQQAKPPTEIPDFSNLDDFIYVPRSAVTFGYRLLSGAKLTFSGKGRLATTEDPGAHGTPNVERAYHDGSIHIDTRATTRVDADGNPVVDPVTGVTLTDPIAPDGRTNSWNYTNSKQAMADGMLAFHTYTAEIVDSALRRKTGARNGGVEIAMVRDMGNFLKTRAKWNLVAGVSLNDLSARTTDGVLANLTTLTDLFSLNGQPIPEAPYSAPSTGTFSVIDAAGNPVLNPDGSAQSITTDTTTLIASQPASRTSATASDATSVTNLWKVRGAYYTFRAGPMVFLPLTSRLRASLSLGAAVIYAGSTYTVTQTYAPETGNELSDTSENSTSRVLPGLFADASLQFDLTERAGFYAGAVFQSAGAYTQRINAATAQYATRIDLANQNGLRAGMTIRF